jgi:hypothetical protein
MAQTATALLTVLKEAWTSEDLQRQFLSDDTPLSRIEKVKSTKIGKQAQTPVHAQGAGGYTSVGASGGSLNPATNQAVNQAVWTLVNHWFQIAIESSALNQASGDQAQAIVSAKMLEIEGAIRDTRRQITRQLVTNGDSIVAQCATGGASATVSLVASPSGTAWGFDALQRNWLYPGMIVDIGTTADTDALVTASQISAVSPVSTAPTITIGTSISTTAGTHFVYIPNPNSATAANPESNGLRNIVNTSGALGNLNPATAGQEYWQAAARDTTTSTLSLDLLLSLQQAVMQQSGKTHTDCWTGLKQQKNFYSLLQNQVRFPTDSGLGAGNVNKVTWNSMQVEAFPSILDSDWFCLTLSDFGRITGAWDKPMWASDIQGSTNGAIWSQGTTQFVDAVQYDTQVIVQRRNTQAAATALTA